MRKFKSFVLAMIGLLCSLSVSAEDFEVDGIYYNITSSTDMTVEVTNRNYTGTVNIPESVTYNGSIYSVTSIESSAFQGCSSLTSVEIGNSVTSIGSYAFHECFGLTSVEIPNSVTSIGDYAFSDCSGLTSVVIPNSVTSIGDHAFYYCDGLTSAESPNSVTSIKEATFCNCSSLTSVQIPNSVTSIGDYAFYYCSGLTSVEIGNSVTSIGSSAFSWCSSLNSVEIPNSVTSIGSSAFWDCSSLTSMQIPNSVTSIGSGAFCGCSGLTSVEIPNSVISIGPSAFSGTAWYNNQSDGVIYVGQVLYEYKGKGTMPSNTSIIVKDGTVSISPSAFSGCSGLTSVEIPNSVTSIGDYAFEYCRGLTSVVIPNSVTSIGDGAFQYCSGLTSVTSSIPANKLFPIDSYTFYDVSTNLCTLYVPKGAKKTYARMEGWNLFDNIVEIHPGYELTITDAGYSTLYLDFTAEIPEGVEVYTAKEVDGVWLQMEQVEEVLPANTGVLVKAPAGTYKFAYSNTTAPSIENNLFKGSGIDIYINVPSSSSAFVLSKVDGEVGMYLAKLTDGSFLNNANEAYLLIDNNKLGLSDDELDTSVDGAQLSLRFNFGGVTDIDEVNTEAYNAPVIYDMYGRKVQQIMRPGLYIINGKKVMMK